MIRTRPRPTREGSTTMFDQLDAALFYPPRHHAYFFRGDRYVKWRPGHGVVPVDGSPLRRLGVDGWKSFPEAFREGVDAALYYPAKNGWHAYFFRGPEYIKWRDGEGVVPTGAGEPTRRIGIDGWKDFPEAFRLGVDAALYASHNERAYFFRGGEYLKVAPGQGVVPLPDGRAVRVLGQDGWPGLPAAFAGGLDAALEYPPQQCIYFYRRRRYLGWEPGDGVAARHPRYLGRLHDGGEGWPGLSHLLGGPTVLSVGARRASLWVYLAEEEAAGRIELRVGGRPASFTLREPPLDAPRTRAVTAALESIHAGSAVRVLELEGLEPAREQEVELRLGGAKLAAASFRTGPEPSRTGRLRLAVGSCSNLSQNPDAPVYRALARARPDLALLLGDTCYYVDGELVGSLAGPPPRDWESVERMLRRQLDARSHPDLARLGRSVPCAAVWDDHDFAYNNAAGREPAEGFVGRRLAAAVFRTLWPAAYAAPDSELALYRSFRWGPVEVFVTDGRYFKHRGAERVWGPRQLQWLLDGLRRSDAPVKLVATATQFLYNRDGQEGHAREAPGEREALLELLAPAGGGTSAVTGRVLLLSGDVHYSELLRPAGSGPPALLELTSSPVRKRNLSDHPKPEKAPGSRVWAARRESYGLVDIEVTGESAGGRVEGEVRIAVRDAANATVPAEDGGPCEAVWDLGTGQLERRAVPSG